MLRSAQAGTAAQAVGTGMPGNSHTYARRHWLWSQFGSASSHTPHAHRPLAERHDHNSITKEAVRPPVHSHRWRTWPQTKPGWRHRVLSRDLSPTGRYEHGERLERVVFDVIVGMLDELHDRSLGTKSIGPTTPTFHMVHKLGHIRAGHGQC